MNDKQVATRRVIAHAGGRVQSGPFENMRVNPDLVSWGDGDVGSRLLGIYEESVHGWMDRLLALDFDYVLNVGCAEGYYSVGFARELPDARVVAVDISQRALNITAQHAAMNRVMVETSLTIPDDVPRGALWLVDVEGDELHILNPEVRPMLKSATIFVELHEWVHEHLFETMLERFSKTHIIEVMNDGARSVNDFEFMADMTDSQRWSLASEGRPRRMKWMLMWPKESS